MKQLSIVLIFIIFSCSPKNNSIIRTEENIDSTLLKLDKGSLYDTVKIEVSYAAIECPCAQWFESRLIDSLDRHYFYLEQGNIRVIDADTLFNGINFPLRLALTGQFYMKEGFPEDYTPSKGEPKQARVFRYYSLKILSNN